MNNRPVSTLLLCFLLVSLGNLHSFAQGLQEDDPSLFHFGSSDQMLHGKYKGKDYTESCSVGVGQVSSIKFKDFIYVAWQGVTGSVNVACLGSTHLKELSQDNLSAGPNVYHGFQDTLGGFAFCTYSPTMAIYNDQLYIFYNSLIDSNRIHYLVIAQEGTVHIANRGKVPDSPTDLVQIKALYCYNSDGIAFWGVDLYDNHIRALIIGKYNYFKGELFQSWQKVNDISYPEKSLGTIGVCDASIDEYLIAWTGMDGKHQLNSAFINKGSFALRAKDNYPDHASNSGPLLFRKENSDDKDVHILWRGADDDKRIWQGVINLADKRSFKQFALPTSIAVTNSTPTLISLNKMVTYMLWSTANTTSNYYANIMMAKAYDYPYGGWMGALLKDEHSLKNIVMPGSNNAGMNIVEQATALPNLYRALELPDLGQCNACGFVTQTLDVKEQLELGYRYFGTNLTNNLNVNISKAIYFDDLNFLHSYVQPVDHISSTCLGEGFEEMLTNTRSFLQNHPGEFVIINLKDLSANPFSTLSIDDILREVLPKYKDVLYKQTDDSEKTLADLLNKPIRQFRGKIILTASDSLLANDMHLLRDIFETSHDNQYRFINTTNTNVDHLVDNQKKFISNAAHTGSYKRVDWQIGLTFNKIACDFNPIKGCLEKPEPGFWHHISHIVECTGEVLEMGKTVVEALVEPKDPRNWATIIGWGISAFGTTSLKLVQEANKKLYPTIYDLQHSNTIRKNNMVNIIYTDASDYIYTDLCMQLMTDLNDYDDMSVHNGHIQLTDEHISVSCSDPYSGIASIRVHGGLPPYTYYWTSTGDTTATATGLTEGHHKVRVTDAMGRTVTRKVYVSMNPNAHSGLASVSMSKTEVQPYGLSNHYEQNCDQLIARVQSNYSTSAVLDTLTASVWIDNQQTTRYVKRHYDLIPARNAATATATVTLYFTQSEFDAFNTTNPAFRLPRQASDSVGIGNVLIWHKPGKSADGSGNLLTYQDSTREILPKAADIVWNDIAERWEITFQTQGFGAYFLTTYDGQQQNQWLTTDAYLKDGKAFVQWQVQEKEVSKYYVEYAYDRKNFVLAGQLKSQGRGRHTYELYHQNLSTLIDDATQNIVYYRVRQIFTNGETAFSEIIPVNYAKDRALYLYPNPVANELTIRSSIETTGKVYTLNGEVISDVILKKGNNTLSTSLWTPGMYVIRAANGEYHKIVRAQP